MTVSTIDTTNIDGATRTGVQLADDLKIQLDNAKADLELRPRVGSTETIIGTWIFTGGPKFRTPSGGVGAAQWIENMNIEAGHSNPHALKLRGNSDGTDIVWQPWVDGSVTGKNFGFNFATENWFFPSGLEIDGEVAWHAGNFDPLTLSPTTLNINGAVAQKVTVLTPAATVNVPTETAKSFWLGNDQAMTLEFQWPSGAHATLGDDYKVSGEIQIRNETGHGALTLTSDTAVTASKESGTRPTGAGELYTLQYQCSVIGSSRYVHWTWVT